MVQHRAMLTMADQRRHFQWSWTTPIYPVFKVTPFLTLNISETVRYTEIVSME